MTYNEYSGIHQWLKRHYGKASKCENESCQNENIKHYEWALKRGKEHERNVDNYIQLCPKCHRKYDFTEKEGARLLSFAKGRVFSKEALEKIAESSRNRSTKPIVQKTINGDFVKEYKTAKQAQEETGICRKAISNVLTNRRGNRKTSGGFIWQYSKSIAV